MGGDDLFSRQPIIEDALAARMHYIFVAKPESHTYLMSWLDAYPQLNQHEVTDGKKETIRYVYQWMDNVPLHGGDKAIQVSWWARRFAPLPTLRPNIVTPHVIPSEARDLPALAEIFEKHSAFGF